jgi:hypothetical protein
MPRQNLSLPSLLLIIKNCNVCHEDMCGIQISIAVLKTNLSRTKIQIYLTKLVKTSFKDCRVRFRNLEMVVSFVGKSRIGAPQDAHKELLKKRKMFKVVESEKKGLNWCPKIEVENCRPTAKLDLVGGNKT